MKRGFVLLMSLILLVFVSFVADFRTLARVKLRAKAD